MKSRVPSFSVFLSLLGLLATAQVSTARLEPAGTLVFAERIFKLVGPSHIDWMQIMPQAPQPSVISESEAPRCRENQPVVEREQTDTKLSSTGKLFTWSADKARIAFVDQDPSIPPPTPNPWGDCTDCFYSVVRIAQAADGKVIATAPLPQYSEHWNYPEAMSWSPDGKMLLLDGEAGSSDSHFGDYWLLDLAVQRWQYLGGGINAKWSPDSSQILWASARDLAQLGKISVWVNHLVLFDLKTMKDDQLTSGISYVSEFYWCDTR